MKTYVFNPFTPVPASPKSHVRGWSVHWAESIGADVAGKDTSIIDADELYLDHGVNFGGGLNLFGGVTEDVMDRLEELLFSKARLWSLDMPMPDYVSQLEKRMGQSTCSKRLTPTFVSALRKRFTADNNWLLQSKLGTELVTIGDSHATAFAPSGSAVLRTNGQTLHGVLRDGLIQKQMDSLIVSPERVTLVYGSIDIRHHIGRQSDPEAALELLCDEYAKTVNQIKVDHMCEVEVAAPVPVEYEGRKIPQTGFYKGTAFAGSQSERDMWTMHFIDMMRRRGVQGVQPPIEWYTMDPEQYAKTYMELGSSVHIAPPYYRRCCWGSK